jgi:cell division protein ZapA (FtsZ GTPase activity inhibitor)
MKYAIANSEYPIETKDQLVKAAEYFDKYLTRFHPIQRVEAASNIEKQASLLGVNIDHDWVKNYSRAMTSNQVSPDFVKSANMRKLSCAGKNFGEDFDANKVIDSITSLEKTADPKKLVDMLFDFDKHAGLRYAWDTYILDPVMTVFGSNSNPEYDAVKIAGDMTNYDVKRTACDEKSIEKIAFVMGQNFKDKFVKNPVQTVSDLGSMEKVAFCQSIEG